MHIGKMIRRLRKEKKMTLLELSQKSGVAIATLSRIENGIMTGTLKSHVNIAKALDIPLTDLYKDIIPHKHVEMRYKTAHSKVPLNSNDAISEKLTSRTANKKMIPLFVRMAKDGATAEETSKPGVEKFIYVVQGRIEAAIGEERYNLTTGGSVYLDASLPHYFNNIGTGEAHLICVACPPIL